MHTLNRISKTEIRDLLGKGWLTHDGLWFYHTYQLLGIETANHLNKAAINSLAPLEVKRIQQILDINENHLTSFNDIETFMHDALRLTLPESVFAKLTFTSPNKNTLHWEWEKGECFAYRGLKAMGIIDEYSCGVMYRIECWLKALGIEFSMLPSPDRCLMHTSGNCAGDISVTLENSCK